MSEIQSIAQNNYILATQQEVSHDNTLSGNGTVDSPLGVVPGYNETVLFEDNAGHTGNFTATEPLSAFNEVAVYISPDPNSEGPSKVVIPMMGRNTSNFKFGWIGTFGGWKNIEWQFVYNNTGMTSFTPVSGAYFGKTTSNQITGSDWSSNSMYMFKIVGINRKAQ